MPTSSASLIRSSPLGSSRLATAYSHWKRLMPLRETPPRQAGSPWSLIQIRLHPNLHRVHWSGVVRRGSLELRPAQHLQWQATPSILLQCLSRSSSSSSSRRRRRRGGSRSGGSPSDSSAASSGAPSNPQSHYLQRQRLDWTRFDGCRRQRRQQRRRRQRLEGERTEAEARAASGNR